MLINNLSARRDSILMGLQRSFCALLRNGHVQRHCLPSLCFAATRMLSTIQGNSDNKKQHLVVALGGNALLKRGQALNIDNQRKNIAEGISSLADILKYNTITLVHGNGPQVGLLALQDAAYTKETGSDSIDLDVLDAETEGMIGYLLEQEIDAVLGKEGHTRGAVTLLSQIIVDPNDFAFQDPTKFIGPIYSKDEAMKLGKPVKPDGEYYRQVVASPKPLRLIDQQLTAVKLLTDNDCIVICAGGGGIPVVLDGEDDSKENRLRGIEAVIDKDRAACMLGKTLGADGLVILTDVPAVALNFGKPNQKFIRSVSPKRMLELATNYDGSKNFPAGSMGPKIESACEFVQSEDGNGDNGRWSMIGSLNDATSMMRGEAGTLVTNDFGDKHVAYYDTEQIDHDPYPVRYA